MSICGLDFGTSNTTLGIISGREPVLTALEAGQTTIPSAIFYEVDGAVLIGCKAIEAYVEGAPGRLMRSLKSVLGTPLIDETTRLGRERTNFRDVIAYCLGAVKRRAEQAIGHELRDVVHGRPVHFVDNAPDADRKAKRTLGAIAREVGFDGVTFQFEPIAAAPDRIVDGRGLRQRAITQPRPIADIQTYVSFQTEGVGSIPTTRSSFLHLAIVSVKQLGRKKCQTGRDGL
jgi:hypothetical chaperone protein